MPLIKFASVYFLQVAILERFPTNIKADSDLVKELQQTRLDNVSWFAWVSLKLNGPICFYCFKIKTEANKMKKIYKGTKNYQPIFCN